MKILDRILRFSHPNLFNGTGSRSRLFRRRVKRRGVAGRRWRRTRRLCSGGDRRSKSSSALLECGSSRGPFPSLVWPRRRHRSRSLHTTAAQPRAWRPTRSMYASGRKPSWTFPCARLPTMWCQRTASQSQQTGPGQVIPPLATGGRWSRNVVRVFIYMYIYPQSHSYSRDFFLTFYFYFIFWRV